jgi:hypothetical protein
MSLLELIPSLSSSRSSLAMSPADPAPQGIAGAGNGAEFERRWEDVIHGRLAEWNRDPVVLDDEGVEPPSREIIGRAIRLAHYLSSRHVPAPQRIVPDGNGGIVFEWFQDSTTESIEISDEGTLEYLRFVGDRLAASEPLAFPGTADGI